MPQTKLYNIMDETQNNVRISNSINCDVGLHSYLRTY
jgi:hypothetical protein